MWHRFLPELGNSYILNEFENWSFNLCWISGDKLKLNEMVGTSGTGGKYEMFINVLLKFWKGEKTYNSNKNIWLDATVVIL